MEHYIRDQNEVIETLRRPLGDTLERGINPVRQQQQQSRRAPVGAATSVKELSLQMRKEQEARASLEHQGSNYESMQKLFSQKSFEMSLPPADEIRVPLELYAVMQDKAITYKSELDELRREAVHLRRQRRSDVEKINKLVQERNEQERSLAAARLRVEQLTSIQADMLKERDHHQQTSTALDDQMRFAQSEAEDRSARLAAVLAENDELRGAKTWLEQKLQGTEEDRQVHVKASGAAQSRLKVALMATAKLAKEKKNLLVAVEEMKRACEMSAAREAHMAQRQREMAAEHEQDAEDRARADAAVAAAAPKFTWFTESILAGRNIVVSSSSSAAASRRAAGDEGQHEDEHEEEEDDDDGALATDAEARAAAEDAMMMMEQRAKRIRVFYQSRMALVESKLMEEHDKHSLDDARGAFHSLANDFDGAFRGGGDEADEIGGDSDDDDDDADSEGTSRKLANKKAGAMQALSLFKYQQTARKAKEAAAAAAVQEQIDEEVHISDEDGEDEEIEEEVEEVEEEEVEDVGKVATTPSAASTSSPTEQQQQQQQKKKVATKKVKKIVVVKKRKKSERSAAVDPSSLLLNPAVLPPGALIRATRAPNESETDDDDSSACESSDGHGGTLGRVSFIQGEVDSSKQQQHLQQPAKRRRKKKAKDVNLVKSALFNKFFKDESADEEKAAVSAATESILSGVRTAEAMIDYVDQCAAESLSLQDLKDRWEAVKHMARARLNETAAESGALSHNYTALLKRRDYFKKKKGGVDSSDLTAAAESAEIKSPVTKHFRPGAAAVFGGAGGGFGSGAPRFFSGSDSRRESNKRDLDEKKKDSDSSKRHVQQQKSTTMRKNNEDNKKQKEDKAATEAAGTSTKEPPPSPKKRVSQRTVGISCKIQPRPETAHWCRNTLIQPDDLNEVDGCLFALLPKIFFELHNLIHDVIREARQRSRITLPIADPASYIGDGERRTIADVHCAMKFDLFALMALRDLLRVVGKNAKGCASAQELRERLVWYRECCESQRMAQLDEKYHIDPALMKNLNIVDRRALFKYRTETHKRFKMPGTLSAAEEEAADPEVVVEQQTAQQQHQQQQPQFVMDTLAQLNQFTGGVPPSSHQQHQHQHRQSTDNIFHHHARRSIAPGAGGLFEPAPEPLPFSPHQHETLHQQQQAHVVPPWVEAQKQKQMHMRQLVHQQQQQQQQQQQNHHRHYSQHDEATTGDGGGTTPQHHHNYHSPLPPLDRTPPQKQARSPSLAAVAAGASAVGASVGGGAQTARLPPAHHHQHGGFHLYDGVRSPQRPPVVQRHHHRQQPHQHEPQQPQQQQQQGEIEQRGMVGLSLHVSPLQRQMRQRR